MVSSGSLLLSASNGKIKACQSEFIQFTFGYSAKRLEDLSITDLIPGFFDSFDISATSSMNSLTLNEDFATSTPARQRKAGVKQTQDEDEFPQGAYYGYGKHANGSEFSEYSEYSYVIFMEHDSPYTFFDVICLPLQVFCIKSTIVK